MSARRQVEKISRLEMIRFSRILFKQLWKLISLAIFRPKNIEAYAQNFAKLYSKMWDYAEHSISNQDFNLPSALGVGPVQAVNRKLAELYKCNYACLSFGGSSGAILILLIAVLPKLQPNRSIVIFDEACHQSTIGGLIFGRWKAVQAARHTSPQHGTTYPLELQDIKSIVEKFGAEQIAAIVLVLPSYDGFRSRTEEVRIYEYAKSLGILVFADGAWDSASFRQDQDAANEPTSICDAWITSPHKRGLSPSSLGCMATNDRALARVWDEALDLGFRSSSLSFVDVMIAEQRIKEIANHEWDDVFKQGDLTAAAISNRVSEIHPNLYVVKPEDVKAQSHDPAHILISTSKLPSVDARLWASCLSDVFDIDIEKSSSNSLLLLCASPSEPKVIDRTISALREALFMSNTITKGLHHS